MTPSERNALFFLAALLLLGTGVRLARARTGEATPTSAEVAALAEQRRTVDSVRAAGGSGRARGEVARRQPNAAGRAPKPRKAVPPASEQEPLRPAASAATRIARAEPLRPVDLDLATAADIEALPWIGPVLAARIVADRDSLGPFGSLAEFQRVRGIGPALARRLADRVTFSQTPRLLSVEDRGKRASSGTRRGPSARPRAP